MSGRVRTLMMKTKPFPPLLHEELRPLPPLNFLVLQVSYHHNPRRPHYVILSAVKWKTGLPSVHFNSLFCQGSLSLRTRTRTSRKKRRLQNTPTTLGSLILSGSHSGPSCSRAATSPPGEDTWTEATANKHENTHAPLWTQPTLLCVTAVFRPEVFSILDLLHSLL